MTHIINPNLRFLCKELKHERRTELYNAYIKKSRPGDDTAFLEYREACEKEGIMSGVLLEGSGRSGKTTASLHFQAFLASKKETGCTINVIRETYNSFKTTLYADYNKVLPALNCPNPFTKQEVATFKLYGNTINLLGADNNINKFLGAGSDYVYFNEMLDIPKEIVSQATMRCRKFWWGDFNPKVADHYVFNSLLTRRDVAHLKTTYKDNPFISPNERIEIESYQPVEASRIAIFYGSQDIDETNKFNAIQKANKYDCEKNPDKFPEKDIRELKRCKYNEDTGTANFYQWSVYGLGERRAPEGLIFPNVVWVKDFPANCEKIYWGLDFGYTESPSTLIKVGTIGNDLFAKIMFYQPTPSINELYPLLKLHLPDDKQIVWADPSGEYGGRTMISSCRAKGLQVYAANAYPGSIIDGISILNKYRKNLIDCPEWRKEQMGYTKARAKVNGVYVTLDTPIDANNHAWDATRITALMNRL